MKKISVDMNFNYFGPDKPTLAPQQMSHFNLSEGDRVVVYQEDEEWEGSVGRDESAPDEYVWYVQLEGESVSVSPDRYEGRAEGYENGRYIGAATAAVAIAVRMLEEGMEPEQVGKYTKLPTAQLETMRDQINRRRGG